MKTNCPYCRKEINLMEVFMDNDLRYVFQALPAFGTRYSSLVMGYVSLFGVTPFAIKAKKLRLIIEEMKRLFDTQSFAFQKKTYKISHAGIAEALDICIKKNFPEHLENHNYLKKCMIGIAEREGKEQSKTAEKDLKIRENKLMAGYERPAVENDHPVWANNHSPLPFDDEKLVDGKRLTPEQIKANLTRVGEIMKGLL